MRAKLKPEEQMTVEEFLAYTEQRPDGERWELIEGVAILNASPTDFHQIIAGNIVTVLNNLGQARKASWVPLLGVGTRVPVSPRSLPQPDVMVKELAATGVAVSDEAVVLFEILSPSNTKADQAWRRKVYASIPNLQHYVTLAQSQVRVERFDRSANWDKTSFDGIDMALALPALSITLPLRAIYRQTRLV